VTLGASDHWLETRTGIGGTETKVYGFFSPWLHGKQITSAFFAEMQF
jgi:hypothetical protein